MRKDCKGYLHMYPDLGGPFQSLQEAEAAINHHLNERRLPEMCQMPSEGSLLEWRIKQSLYFPDGTPKRGPNSPARKNPHYQERLLVKALLDQYNDYHNPCKDLAHELKDLLRFQYAWVVSCCCVIEPNDDGLCYGCCNNGSREIMHPNNTRAYIGGHVNGYLPFGGDDYSDDDEDEEAYVARLRFIFREWWSTLCLPCRSLFYLCALILDAFFFTVEIVSTKLDILNKPAHI
ncbi:unnamed protein product [Urochloa decumbens]|uniref:Uncharacterized protein n=1 Tax=Urochloa decumbens TaxID=240449 RepID=A0ABC9DC17_9POAL